ncbi:MAG: SsrA-binding protein SmpB [bacterium]|nr:SsrA-binding protein SmpB [Candidatus Minthenecus merdequi]
MTTEIKNKRASFDYFLSNHLVAGIVLYGTEIKSIREGKASLADTYCIFIGNELWIKNMQISAYRLGTFYNHDVKRDRKLLLNKRELRKFQRATKETGFTVIPLRIFIADNGYAKVEIALARGKKAYDKRQTLKENDARREMREIRSL